MRCLLKRFACAVALVAAVATSVPSEAQVFFEENFDSLLPTLGDSVNERIGTAISTRVASDPDSTPLPGVWSATTPGWTVNNNLSTYNGAPTTTPGVPGVGVADYGVDEWQGWTFVDKDFWTVAAGQQRREEFGTVSGASGTVAVADPDEYFDLGDPDDPTHGGYFSSSMTSPSFNVTAGNFYGVGFASSWRDESFDDDAPGFTNANNQAVEVIVKYDNGTEEQITRWHSDDTDAAFPFKNDLPDELFVADGGDLFFEAPTGATTATLEFRLANAGNDWWWAVDNIEVNDLIAGGAPVFTEDFEDTTLGNSVNERLAAGAKVTAETTAVTTILGTDYPTSPRPDSFTHTGPTGWTVDNTGTPGVGNDEVGVFEYEQWTFATPEFWQFTDGQGRQDFTNGTGVFAIADGDEWDDLNDPGGSGDLTTFMETPDIDISALEPGADLVLMFDSSWRDEDNQEAIITAYLDGNPVEILHWNSDSASPFFHDDNTNEEVAVVFNPGGASTVKLRWSYAGNDDWWWAIDNIQLSQHNVPEPSSAVLFGLAGVAAVGMLRRRQVGS